MTPQHWQACFDVQTKSCVCPIENKDARVREAAPEMREMLLKLEWCASEDKGLHCSCPECGGEANAFLAAPGGVHRAGCALAALLERVR